MEKTYLVLIEKKGVLKLVAEFEEIEDCNEYLSDAKYRVVSSWRKKKRSLRNFNN